eukprot:g17379.t1
MAFYSGFKGFGKAKGFFKGKGPRVDPSHKVWIGGIAPGTSWKDAGRRLEHMNQAGKAKWVEVFEGKGAGTGTAAYGSTEEVAQAINMLNGTPLGGSQITVDAWVKAPKEPSRAARRATGLGLDAKGWSYCEELVRRTLQLRRQFTERSEGKVTEGCALKSLERRKKDGE